jgi:Sulfotransferase domain
MQFSETAPRGVHHEKAREIRDFNPYASAIIMLRNPVDMIHSFHSQQLYQGGENIADFEAALEAEESRKRGLYLPANSGTIEGLFYREVATVAEHVQRYLDVFGRDKVHIILFDDLKRDTAAVYRETLSFLGVTPEFQPEVPIINPNKQARSQTLQKFMTSPPAIVRWFGCVTMSPRLRQRLFGRIRSLNTRYAPRAPMPPELRRRLQAEFAPDVEWLGKLLDRDLSHWSRN